MSLGALFVGDFLPVDVFVLTVGVVSSAATDSVISGGSMSLDSSGRGSSILENSAVSFMGSLVAMMSVDVAVTSGVDVVAFVGVVAGIGALIFAAFGVAMRDPFHPPV